VADSFAGRSAVVTGASSGIGAETAAAGASVTVAARRADRLEALAAEIRASRGSVAVQPTDMRCEEDIRRLFVTARERFGGVGNLVEVQRRERQQTQQQKVANDD